MGAGLVLVVLVPGLLLVLEEEDVHGLLGVGVKCSISIV